MVAFFAVAVFQLKSLLCSSNEIKECLNLHVAPYVPVVVVVISHVFARFRNIQEDSEIILRTLAYYFFWGTETSGKYLLRHDLFKTAVSISRFAHQLFFDKGKNHNF